MAGLTELALVAQVVIALAVLAIIGYAAFELRRFHEREDVTAAVGMVKATLTPEFLEAVQILYQMPDDMDAADVERDPVRQQAASTVGFHYEVLGYMVYRRIVPLEMLDELAGGAARSAWAKLRPWVFALREERHSANAYEWLQWLAERLNEAPRGKADGAYVAYRDWRA